MESKPLDEPLMESLEDELDDKDKRRAAGRTANTIIQISLAVALAWWGFGLYTVISTKSLAVLASLVDATIDLAAQGVLLAANRIASGENTGIIYPVGVSRLEPIGVIVCAVLMGLASGFVIYDSIVTIFSFWPNGPDMVFTDVASIMLAVVVVVKIVVWRVAKREYDRTNNVSLEALALDNYNDILSNFSALLFASLTRVSQATWWLDPVGGVLISIYIIRSWFLTAFEQVNMLVGKVADPDFLSKVEDIARSHDSNAELDTVRAYHFGPKLLVEIELVMDRQTSLEVSHDVGIKLQDEIEHLEECERCFVHIDYQHREHDDHDVTVPVQKKLSAFKHVWNRSRVESVDRGRIADTRQSLERRCRSSSPSV
jgi:cation diffusion facilitator family transporter|eukprot:TRINITY_DN17295_c0_g1_i1.p1 TRINITY_DN17295_c0_g1~~TRINITY_DN17295_c0_g1_i1.p1  ORF type:complete len:372 (-),score=58.70 TRINITY_DN17295_c0_g1_i1:69-1184(-)